VKTPLAICRVKLVHHFAEHCRIFDLDLFVTHLRGLRKLPAKLTEKERLQYKTKEMIGDSKILC
jgi:hypothetical protein